LYPLSQVFAKTKARTLSHSMDTDIALLAGPKKRPAPVGTISYFISGLSQGSPIPLIRKSAAKI